MTTIAGKENVQLPTANIEATSSIQKTLKTLDQRLAIITPDRNFLSK
jgi:hypothetical protein